MSLFADKWNRNFVFKIYYADIVSGSSRYIYYLRQCTHTAVDLSYFRDNI